VATDELKEQLNQMSEREQLLQDELNKIRLQQQQQQQMKMTKDKLRHEECRKSSAEEMDSKESKEQKEEKEDDKVISDTGLEAGKMISELISVKDKESELMDQIMKILKETAEATDQKQQEFLYEIQEKMSNFTQQRSSSAQDVFHHRWQMVNDLDTLSSQPDVETMTRQEFKRKVVEMVQEKWMPRNVEYVENGVHDVRREMATLFENTLRGLVDDIAATVRCNTERSLKLADEFQNACQEEIKLWNEIQTATATAAVTADK